MLREYHSLNATVAQSKIFHLQFILRTSWKI